MNPIHLAQALLPVPKAHESYPFGTGKSACATAKKWPPKIAGIRVQFASESAAVAGPFASATPDKPEEES
jgi:hypothetical protein